MRATKETGHHWSRQVSSSIITVVSMFDFPKRTGFCVKKRVINSRIQNISTGYESLNILPQPQEALGMIKELPDVSLYHCHPEFDEISNPNGFMIV